MSLTLTTLRCPDGVPPQTRRVDGHDFSIGRGVDNDWVLPDPNRHLSKRHCRLTFDGEEWRLADSSTNGTFVNLDDAPVGPSGCMLRDGDHLRLGLYEIDVRIMADSPAAPQPDLEDLEDAGDDRTRVFRSAPPRAASAVADADLDVLDTNSPFGGSTPRAPAPMEIPEDWNSDPFAEEPPAPAAEPVAPPKLPELVGDGPDLMAAFLRGAGIDAAAPEHAEAAMEAMGAAFRAVVTGVRQVLQARASIKSEFRIEQTMIRARGNNPLKFSSSDDAALASLVGLGRRNDMPAAEAVRDALRDIQLHELASMSAMQAAVKSLVATFDPEKLRAAAEQGGLALVAAQRKARAWDAFEALHARTTMALADDFDSVFGKAFAVAYEQTLHEASEREPL